MKPLIFLKKNELLILAQKHNILVNSRMTKIIIIKHLKASKINFNIPLIINNDILSKLKQYLIKKENIIHKLKKRSIQRIQPPSNYITLKQQNHITILPQSENKVLVIWNAPNNIEARNKAWQITNDFGLDILLPNYARSTFININLLKNHLFYIHNIINTEKKVYFSSSQYTSKDNYQDLSKLQKKKFDKLMINKFKNSSSDNNFSSSNNHYKV